MVPRGVSSCEGTHVRARTQAHHVNGFVDNMYLGLTGMDENLQTLPSVLLFAQVVPDVVYDDPLKWENSGTEVD